MSEERKLLHRLAIDLKRSIDDIKENMTIYEFFQWAEYYKEEITIHTLSNQISQLTEYIYKANYDGDVTIYDFMPNATTEQKEEARTILKQKRIEKEIMENM